MITLRNLYTVFSHDPQWSALAARSLQPVRAVYLSEIGNTDITLIKDSDLRMLVDMSLQPQDVKAKAQSCMNILRSWAGERGNPFAEPEPEKPREKVVSRHPKRGEIQQKRRESDILMTLEEWQSDTRKRHGTIERDLGSKGWKGNKRAFKDCWRAVITVNGQRYRYRAHSREECREWLKAVCEKRILPTDNSADWWRMEQTKDESARIDEIIVSQAEEAVMLYDYHQTGDTSVICDYLTKRLLPHMMYYAAHTLKLGQESSLRAARQAAGLLLVRITTGRPVLNFTATFKRMLRVYKQRGDFFYYDNVPEQVKLMVNKINFDGLAEVWKVTKDRRI